MSQASQPNIMAREQAADPKQIFSQNHRTSFVVLENCLPTDTSLYKTLSLTDSQIQKTFPITEANKLYQEITQMLQEKNSNRARQTLETVNKVWNILSNPSKEYEYRIHGTRASIEKIINRDKIKRARKYLSKLRKERDATATKTNEPQKEITSAESEELEMAINNLTEQYQAECEQSTTNETSKTDQNQDDNTTGETNVSDRDENTNATANDHDSETNGDNERTQSTRKAEERRTNRSTPKSRIIDTEEQNHDLGGTRIKKILQYATRKGKTKAQVVWDNKNDSTTWEDIEELKNHPRPLNRFLEALKINRRRMYNHIAKKYSYLIDAAKRK